MRGRDEYKSINLWGSSERNSMSAGFSSRNAGWKARRGIMALNKGAILHS
jgi:hypothetical protein